MIFTEYHSAELPMRNILVVDPSPEFFEAVRTILRNLAPEANVCAAEHSAACMRALDAARLDLILLHFAKASSDASWATLKTIRESCADMPVLAIFDAQDEASSAEAMQRGASDVAIRTAAFSTLLPIAIRRVMSAAEMRRKCASCEKELAQLREAQRARGEFMSVITHDLRTPLVGMRIYAQFLSSGRLGPLAQPQKEKIEAIYRNAERLTHCIEGLQRYQRLEAPRLELVPSDFDLRTILGEVITSVMPACMEKGITLGQSGSAEPINVHADRELILEVVRDLLDNAVKFTAARGSISLDVVQSPDKQVSITIIDSGCGIPPELLGRLFDPAFRPSKKTHPESGLGLGLRMVKRILDAHQSSIQIDSTVGTGTRVRFSLPPAQAMQPRIPDDSTRILRRRAVLVVDDEEDNLACTRSVLEYAGYDVLSASSLEEAKAQLDEGHVDAVLLDIALRGADGFETLQALKRSAATSNLPVIMVSAKADDDVRAKAARMGADGFVVKPFVPAKLLRELGAVMDAHALV